MERIGRMVIFARVVEEQSFSGAARQLGLSKATVSKEISALEDELGVRLLHRTSRQLSTTEAGEAFFARCKTVVLAADAAIEVLGPFQDDTPRGTLRISAPVTFGQRWLAPSLVEFARKYPEIQVDLSLTDHVVDLIEEGFDVAVRIAKLPDSSLIAKRLGPATRRVVASPAYLARKGLPASVADLANHDCCLYAYQLTGAETWQIGEESVRVAGRFRSNNGEALVHAALGDFGLALLPDFLVDEHIAKGTLVNALPGREDTAAATWAVYPHTTHVPAKVKAFVEHTAFECGRRS